MEKESFAFIDTLLKSKGDKLKLVLDNPEKYEVQILYTQINRGESNIPSFKHFSYRLNDTAYFNPASLVKLPVVCLALQKLNKLTIDGLNKNSRLSIGADHDCQTPVINDPTSPEGFPTIAHYMKKILVASDNDAYNRLYEFLGQEYINSSLSQMGYTDTRIIRRFADCTDTDNRHTNPFVFYDESGEIFHTQPSQHNDPILKNPLKDIKKGKAYINNTGQYIDKPFDYSFSNNLSLKAIHDILIAILFPESVPANNRFYLAPDDYSLIMNYMSMLPRESDIPLYENTVQYPDNLKKYFIFGDTDNCDILNSSIRIFNVVGRADGYLSDCSYIIDFKNKIEFILAAVIYVNEDQILKDGKYEYDTIGLPFLAELGRTIYAYERDRKRHIFPDLDKFKYYTHNEH